MGISKKPRLLFLAQLPPPVHGSAVMNRQIFESGLLHEHFQIDWIDTSPGESLDNIGKITILKLWTYIKIHLELVQRLLFAKYDASYFTIAPYGLPFYKDSFLVAWLKVFRVKRIFHMHGKGIQGEIKNSGWKSHYYNFIFRNSYVIHLSTSLLSDLECIHSIRRKFVLPNGIFGFSVTVSTLRPPELLYLSNFFETKGALQLLMVAKRMVERKLEFRLRLAGGWVDKSFRERLLGYFNSFDWEGKVEIVGPIYGEDKERILEGSDMLIFPSCYKMECFPLVILEGMSCGLVVVASKAGAIPEILEEGDLGVLIDPDNEEEFYSEISGLIRDRDRMIRLGNESRRAFELKYSFNVFENNFVRLLTEIVFDKNS